MAEGNGREREAGRADPGAFAVALGATAHDPTLAKDVRAHLREQTALAHIQAEELEDEVLWRHWSLRVRHISDVLKLGFELSLAFIGAQYAPNWGRLHLKWGEALWWLGRKDEAAKQFAAAAKLELTQPEKTQLTRMESLRG